MSNKAKRKVSTSIEDLLSNDTEDGAEEESESEEEAKPVRRVKKRKLTKSFVNSEGKPKNSYDGEDVLGETAEVKKPKRERPPTSSRKEQTLTIPSNNYNLSYSVPDDVTDAAANINFDEMLNSASNLFAEQALQSRNGIDITPKELELSRARADNFIASINNMIEVTNSIELLKADKLKFRRKDELIMLNNLKEQFGIAIENSHKALKLCTNQVSNIYERLEEGEDLDLAEIEKLGSLQSYMDGSVSLINNLGKGLTNLIKSERSTGGRNSSGGLAKTTTNLAKLLSGSGGKKDEDPEDSGFTGNKPRQLSKEEVGQILNNQSN